MIIRRIVSIALLQAACAFACKIPVFDYAKQNWVPEKFPVVVFYSGQLTKQQNALIESMERKNTRDSMYVFYKVDVTGRVPKPLLDIWEKNKGERLPLLLMLYPSGMKLSDRSAFKSGLTADLEAILFQSALKDMVASHYDEKAINFWVIARFDAGSRDDETEKKFLRHKEKILDRITKEFSNMIGKGVIDELYARIRISSPHFRVNLSDPENILLSSYLRHLFPKLFTKKKAFILPVYGRGRALGFIDEENINQRNIYETAEFLIGPCSCLLKAGNPGFDIPLPVDWDRLAKANQTPERIELFNAGLTPDSRIVKAGQDKPEMGDRKFSLAYSILIVAVLILITVVLLTTIISWKMKRE